MALLPIGDFLKDYYKYGMDDTLLPYKAMPYLNKQDFREYRMQVDTLE